MIKRYCYEVWRDDIGDAGIDWLEDGGGEWVKWEDAERLICSSGQASIRYMNRYTNLLVGLRKIIDNLDLTSDETLDKMMDEVAAAEDAEVINE